MRSRPQRALLAAAVASAFVFTTGFGFGKKEAPPATFDPAADVATQASSFIAPNKAAAKQADKVGNKVALTSCNVMFAFKSNASAGTEGGLFSTAGNTSRAEATVRVEYNLHGMDDATMQSLTEEICRDAEQQMKDAGYDVVPAAELAADENFKGIHANAKAAPYEFKAPGKGGATRYMVYAPAGQGVYDPRFIGTAAGLGSALKAAKGTSPQFFEGRVMDTFKADAVNINLLVDFAELAGDGHKGMLGGLASKDSAQVKNEARLSISGSVKIQPQSLQKCWDRFGKRECMIDAAKIPQFDTVMPVISSGPFYNDLVDETSTGDKVGSTVSKGLALVSAMGGVNSRSFKVTRYGVHVDPARYGDEVKKHANGFVGMALASARATKKGK